MTKFLTTILALGLTATTAFAETFTATVQVERATPVYQTVNIQVPRTQCNDVQVPIYGTNKKGANGADVLAGMIIGGLLGKGISGKDDGAAAGAVLGGIISAENGSNEKVIVGYKSQRQCAETVGYETRREFTGYRVQYNIFGLESTAVINDYVQAGDTLEVEITVRVK